MNEKNVKTTTVQTLLESSESDVNSGQSERSLEHQCRIKYEYDIHVFVFKTVYLNLWVIFKRNFLLQKCLRVPL